MAVTGLIVVAYDISSDRRRMRMVKVLKDLGGRRVNFSVFEFRMEKEKLPELKRRILSIINRKRDCVLFYSLCAGCECRRDAVGSAAVTVHNEPVIIV